MNVNIDTVELVNLTIIRTESIRSIGLSQAVLITAAIAAIAFLLTIVISNARVLAILRWTGTLLGSATGLLLLAWLYSCHTRSIAEDTVVQIELGRVYEREAAAQKK